MLLEIGIGDIIQIFFFGLIVLASLLGRSKEKKQEPLPPFPRRGFPDPFDDPMELREFVPEDAQEDAQENAAQSESKAEEALPQEEIHTLVASDHEIRERQKTTPPTSPLERIGRNYPVNQSAFLFSEIFRRKF